MADDDDTTAAQGEVPETVKPTAVGPETPVEEPAAAADEPIADETPADVAEESAGTADDEELKTTAEADEAAVAEAALDEPEVTEEADAAAVAASAPPTTATRAPSSKSERAKAAQAEGGPPVVRAHAKYVRTSARKARLVCDHIRGKDVEEARAILQHTPRHVAEAWSKLLESAVANAEHNHELIGDDLMIASITADEGPTIKRFRPRAMGRATEIRKRTSHLSIALTPKKETR